MVIVERPSTVRRRPGRALVRCGRQPPYKFVLVLGRRGPVSGTSAAHDRRLPLPSVAVDVTRGRQPPATTCEHDTVITIDVSEVTDERTLHVLLKRELGFPDF